MIINKPLVISLIIAAVMSLICLMEDLNAVNFFISDLDMSIIVEIEFVFVQIFLGLLPILYINYIVKDKAKYIIYFISFFSFLTYLLIVIPNSPYSNVEIITGAIIHSSFISIILIGSYLIAIKYKSYKFFYLIAISTFIFSFFVQFMIFNTQKNIYDTRKNEKELNIAVGSFLERLYNYNIIAPILEKNKEESLSEIQNYQKKFLQIDIDTISTNPKLLGILKANGYCKEWKKFKKVSSRDFNNTADIDSQCNDLETTN